MSLGNNWHPITLRAEDSAPAADPQATMIAATEALAVLQGELSILRDQATRWRHDPLAFCGRAQPRLVELHAQAGRIQDLLQTLSQGYRAAGTYAGLGVRT